MANNRAEVNSVFEVKLTVDKLLKEREMSMRELSRRLGLTRESVRKIVNGSARRITLDVIAKMCEVLNCDITDIMHLQPRESASKDTKEERKEA